MSWDETSIRLRAVYDENFSSDDIEDVSVIETELIADFWADFEISCGAECIPAHIKVVSTPGEMLVFQRFEPRDYTG